LSDALPDAHLRESIVFPACAGYPPFALIGEGSHLDAERKTLSDTPWATLR
jgi:hypothetical protein